MRTLLSTPASAHEKHSRTILCFVCIANSATAKTVRNKYINKINI